MSTVSAQLPGVFYRRPNPEADPYVEEGSPVEPGQTVALIEVMKTFNEVKAEAAGTVTAFLLQDGDEVEMGQDLVEIADA